MLVLRFQHGSQLLVLLLHGTFLRHFDLEERRKLVPLLHGKPQLQLTLLQLASKLRTLLLAFRECLLQLAPLCPVKVKLVQQLFYKQVVCLLPRTGTCLK